MLNSFVINELETEKNQAKGHRLTGKTSVHVYIWGHNPISFPCVRKDQNQSGGVGIFTHNPHSLLRLVVSGQETLISSSSERVVHLIPTGVDNY